LKIGDGAVQRTGGTEFGILILGYNPITGPVPKIFAVAVASAIILYQHVALFQDGFPMFGRPDQGRQGGGFLKVTQPTSTDLALGIFEIKRISALLAPEYFHPQK
jgi:hypothetical protein